MVAPLKATESRLSWKGNYSSRVMNKLIKVCCLVGVLLGGFIPAAPAAFIFSTNAVWRFLPGTAEASSPDPAAWRAVTFTDTAFTNAPAPFWYGDVLPGGTDITGMINSYSCIFMRRTFVLTNVADVAGLRLGARCDDGYIAWINGVEVKRYNMNSGNFTYNQFASTNASPDPAVWLEHDLTNVAPASFLVVGTNVMAVQVFNGSLASSDLGIDLALQNTASDAVAPAVVDINPQPGNRATLTQITVAFNQPVLNVNASDLRINGVAATGMTGGNDTYTFTFPQPAYGTVTVNWAGAHGIVDYAVPANAFNAAAPGATWQYNLADTTSPTMANVIPFTNALVRSLTQIQVVFSEAVTGVDAADLRINGAPATNVVVQQPNDYLFRFPQPPTGTVQVAWSESHGIRDLAVVSNNFLGGNWTYLLDPNAPLPNVRINEFVAGNVSGLRDEDNAPQDWVELYNASSNVVSLAGWALTDDENDDAKWVFPAVSLASRGYLIVFCSAKDRKPTTPGSKLHTNFKLNPEGEFLALYNNESPRQAMSVFNPFPNQRGNISYGYDATDALRYFQTPSPGSNNPVSTITGVVADTKFSHKRGFYDTNFSLTITCATPGVTIRYTLDGIAPTASTGTVYTGPIAINRTTILRAAAFKTGLLASDVDAQTYLFLSDVITQADETAPGAGWPAQKKANGGGQNYDYGMDPQVVNDPLYSGTIKNDLKSIPTFSIVMNIADWVNIYSNPGADGIANERQCSLELLYPDDTEGFQINCGLRIRGGFSRSQENPKHAFRVFFRQEYGASKLNYPVFGSTGASSFDKFDLRTMQNYSWSFGGDSSMMCFRDVFSRDTQLTMGRYGTRGNFFHLYINGIYWGLYNTEERPEASFAESYVGGAEENYDVIKTEAGPYTINATDGNMDAWTRLWQAATNGFGNDTNYFKVQGLNVDGSPNSAFENLLNVPDLIDYMLVIIWGGNKDAPISNFIGNNSPNNWYGFRDRSGTNGGFRFVSHDAEHTLLPGDINIDRTGPFAAGDPTQGGVSAATALSKSNPQYIWSKLYDNAEFRMLAADHIQRHFFNGGVFTLGAMRASLLTRSNEINRAIVGESARWGDAKVTTPYTRATWINALSSVFTSFLPQRSAIVLSQLRTDNLWPTVTAPTFNSYGGLVPAGFNLYMTNANASSTLYYTLNGTDPRLRGGAVSGSALAYVANTPITINFQTTIRARVRSGTTWSPITEARFYTAQDYRGLVVSELMYHAPDAGVVSGDNLDFLELKNAGTNIIDLSGATFTDGINFTFPDGTRLSPGQFFLLGRSRPDLQNKYPGLTVHGVYTGKLDNGGEQLTLVHGLNGSVILSFGYKDSGRWPITPDGYGFSLATRNPNANAAPGNPASWRASTVPGGSPGADDPAPTIAPIVINEALTHTDPPAVDSIELHNPTAATVNVGGWFLTDDAAFPTKFRIPDATTIEAGGYRVFSEADFNSSPDTNRNFSLNSTGDEVYLFSGDANTNLTGYSHGFSFGAAQNGVSFGRHVISTGDDHFVAQAGTSLHAPNAGPLVGPVVIKQINYHPPDLAGGLDNSDDEFIVLQNITGNTVALYDPVVATNTWRLRDAVDFDFPSGATLNASAMLLVVSFPPTNAVMLAAFRAKYGSFGGAPVFGPYSGKLDNSTDSVELRRPDSPNAGQVPYILVDAVNYQDSAPWPPGADGSGGVLQRINLAAYGNDPINWISAAPLQIITPPASRAVTAGSSVTFSVLASGTGTIRYQWRFNSLFLMGETNAALTLANVGILNQGSFSVTITDITGSIASVPATLSVLGVRPVITGQPQGITVTPGESVTLSITALGTLPMNYSWRSNGSTVITNIMLHDYTCFFTIQNVRTNFGFKVGITNTSGQPLGGLSSNALVTVLLDTDGDRLPDDWEIAYGLNHTNQNDATDDVDLDGLTNWQEYTAGTDPRDLLSYLHIVARGDDGDGGNVVSFMAVSNRTYSVRYSDTIQNGIWTHWTDVPAQGTNRTVFLTNTPLNSLERFYRLLTPRTQ